MQRNEKWPYPMHSVAERGWTRIIREYVMAETHNYLKELNQQLRNDEITDILTAYKDNKTGDQTNEKIKAADDVEKLMVAFIENPEKLSPKYKKQLDQRIAVITNERNEKGETPLQYAVYNNNHLAAGYLLRYGANPTIVNNNNTSSLAYALSKYQAILDKKYESDIERDIDIKHIKNIITGLIYGGAEVDDTYVDNETNQYVQGKVQKLLDTTITHDEINEFLKKTDHARKLVVESAYLGGLMMSGARGMMYSTITDESIREIEQYKALLSSQCRDESIKKDDMIQPAQELGIPNEILAHLTTKEEYCDIMTHAVKLMGLGMKPIEITQTLVNYHNYEIKKNEIQLKLADEKVTVNDLEHDAKSLNIDPRFLISMCKKEIGDVILFVISLRMSLASEEEIFRELHNKYSLDARRKL